MVHDLRQTIRSILAEELANYGVRSTGSQESGVRQELVSIHSDRDLARFVDHLLRLARDSRSREDIESGRLVFRLEGAGRTGVPPERQADHRPSTGRTENFARGLITESQIQRLPADVNVVSLGKGAVLTPLAKDAIRQAGIKIERVKT